MVAYPGLCWVDQDDELTKDERAGGEGVDVRGDGGGEVHECEGARGYGVHQAGRAVRQQAGKVHPLEEVDMIHYSMDNMRVGCKVS